MEDKKSIKELEKAKIKELEEIEKNLGVSKNYLKQLYNRKTKSTFLRDGVEDKGTREVSVVYLLLASKWEKKIGKDLFEFSREEALDMFSNSFTSRHTSLRTLHSVCKQYCAWATARGFNKTGVNVIELINFQQHIMPMLNVNGLEGKFLTEEEIWEMEDIARNYQDFVCLAPIFYGIKGSRASELVNLKREDMSGVTNTLTLTNIDGLGLKKKVTQRTMKVSERLFKVFIDAHGESEYNRRGEEGKGGRTTANLKEGSEYIIKPTTVNGEDFVTAQTVATRAKRLLEEAGEKLGRDNYFELSVNDVYQSGKLHMLKQIEQEKGSLDTEDFKAVNRHFGDSEKNYANIRQLYQLVNTKTE